MHYDGTKFSQRERVVTFGSKDAAYKKAVSLLNAFPVLKRYTLAVESNFR